MRLEQAVSVTPVPQARNQTSREHPARHALQSQLALEDCAMSVEWERNHVHRANIAVPHQMTAKHHVLPASLDRLVLVSALHVVVGRSQTKPNQIASNVPG